MSRTANNVFDQTRTRLSWAAAAAGCSALLLIWCVSQSPQSAVFDVAEQLTALKQYRAGIAPTINHQMQPRFSDLSQEELRWIAWWPPGTQLAVLPFLAQGFSYGGALRALAAVSLFVGSVGWAFWCARFRLTPALLALLCAALPWMRFCSNHFFVFHIDAVYFALAPWGILGFVKVQELLDAGAGGVRFALCAVSVSLLLGCFFLVKYSAVLLLGSAAFFLFLRAARSAPGRGRAAAWAGAQLFFIAVPVLCVSLLNRIFCGQLNSFTQSLHPNVRLGNFLFLFAFPALSLADANALVRFVFMHPQSGFWQNQLVLALVGIPGSTVVGWLLLKMRPASLPERFARSLVLVSSLLLCAVWLGSLNAADYDTRHFMVPGVAGLPLVLQELLAAYKGTRRRLVRLALASWAGAFVFLPLSYGCVSALYKAATLPRDYAPGESGLYNNHLALRDVPAVRARLEREFCADTDIWYFPDMLSTLDIPGRALNLPHDYFLELIGLHNRSFSTSRPLRAQVLLPQDRDKAETNRLILAAFVQAQTWERREIPGCNYTLWSAWLIPAQPYRPADAPGSGRTPSP